MGNEKTEWERDRETDGKTIHVAAVQTGQSLIESSWGTKINEKNVTLACSTRKKTKKQVNCWTGADGHLLNSTFKLCDKTRWSFIYLSSALNARSVAARLKTVGSLPPPRPPQRPVFKTARTYIGLFEMSPIRSVLMFRGSIGGERRSRRHARKINSFGSCVGSRQQL